MKTKLIKATRMLSAFALLGAIIACGGDDDDSDESTTEAQGVAAAQPTAAGAAPGNLQLGQPPASLQVPIPPSMNFVVAENGEYQIDVTAGMGADPKLYVYQGETLVDQDDDGGDGLNARMIRFLEPGTYSVRVTDIRARPFTAQVAAQRLQALTPVGAITLGTPSVVTIPDFPIMERPRNDRDASRALTLNVAAAGQYTCTASADNNKDPKMALIQNGQLLEE
ncbi:MAG TPA: hypothetical protein DEF51_40805, partial [Myxococcales bacterium]|nr:hypothetical protein [Myxococcales bacterium]